MSKSKIIFIRILLLVLITLNTTSCMLSYVAKNGISQFKILWNRENINKYLKENSPPENIKDKLNLVLKVRDFCFNELKLKKTKNYSSYVQLKDPYVSYLLRVAPKYELKSYEWSFPIVGKFPYLGFFDKKDALDEQQKYKDKNFDTYVRGVTAFSTLGWFNDPILSSMLNYNNYDLVNLIIHETIHSTLFIKDNAEFNEQLATFLAQVGTEMFYKKYEGVNSETINIINNEGIDDKTFSKFITGELDDLKKWYKDTNDINDNMKNDRIKSIQTKFENNILPTMKTTKYKYFSKAKLNNASLLPYMTYMADLSEFEKLHIKLGSTFDNTLNYLKKLESSKKPMQELKDYL